MKTTFPKSKEIARPWHLVNADGQILGRLATSIVRLLMGKDKKIYSPHMDCGDFVVVLNAQSVRLTGNNKLDQKIDFRHSGYPGGDTMTPYREFMKSHPDRAISLAVSGMLPKNRLRSRLMKRLKVYKSDAHPHGANFKRTSPTAAVATPA